jgi:hypothetical protein
VEGTFDWAAPDVEVHAFADDLERPFEAYPYGRRMYETMAYWERPANTADQSAAVQEYGKIWLKETVAGDLSIGGPSSRRTRSKRRWWTSTTCVWHR